MSIQPDRTQIRALLSRDRSWALYALGDLADGFYEHTTWQASPDGEGLLLLYAAFETPVLFAAGAPRALAPLIDGLNPQVQCYLSIRPDVLPLIKAGYAVSHETPMWRMVLDRAAFQPAGGGARRLARADFPALQRLFADGEAADEAPDFFVTDMVERGVFYGVYEGAELVAVAGTHLVVPEEGVAAVGSVYTRRDRRGRGLARATTSAVTAKLLEVMPPQGIVGLNVKQANAAAIRVYELLGYRRYCAFYEGLAHNTGLSRLAL
jgi:GNAT superfamily N-acetyltransferase